MIVSDSAQLVVSVEFASTDGRTWEAIGGGDTIEAAVAFARDSCPADTTCGQFGGAICMATSAPVIRSEAAR